MDPEAHKQFHPYTTDAIVAASWDPVTASHIPFRASLRHKHSTWARTNFSRPELYLQPQSVPEIRLIVSLARQLKRQIVVVGSGHSPSDLTCTSSWMVNLDGFRSVVSEDAETRQITVEAGIRLHDFIDELEKRGWAMPNLGSIVEQSIAGVIATATHGSSLQHGLLSESVVGLTVMLANGNVVQCSKDHNADLFCAALVSLGAIGIVTHVRFQAVPAFRVCWEQAVMTLPRFLESYDHVWEESEFVRCWWFPYSERTIVWHGKKVEGALQEPPKSWYGATFGRYTYEALLYVATWIPSFMPWVERFVFNMQYGWEEGVKGTAVQNSHQALTMDCLFSQFVNEWSIPLSKGPEAITRLQHWLSGRADLANIPISPAGIYVHAPIEARVTDSSRSSQNPRAWLDQSIPDGPTLYLNATLYRPFLRDVPHWQRYYAAFEHLMKDLGGKPHWAKNFVTPTPSEFWRMYPALEKWVRIREQVDPTGVFVTDWLRRHLLGREAAAAIAQPQQRFLVVGEDGQEIA